MKIVTLTANMLAETTCEYATAKAGATQRAQSESFQVGGKGINVAKMARRLGREALAVCFPEGRTGQRCMDWLATRPFAVRAVASPMRPERETREGWVVRTPDGIETTYLGADRPTCPEAWRAALTGLEGDRDIAAFALCGSIPGWSDALSGPVEALLRRLAAEGRIAALDTYGAPLAGLVGLPWTLVKINDVELRGLACALDAGFARRGIGAVEWLAGQAAGFSVAHWVITHGGGTVHVLDRSGACLSMRPPEVEEVSPTGCGDVLLAATLHFMLEGLPVAEAVGRAMPYAAANAAHPGVADFELSVALELSRS